MLRKESNTEESCTSHQLQRVETQPSTFKQQTQHQNTQVKPKQTWNNIFKNTIKEFSNIEYMLFNIMKRLEKQEKNHESRKTL